VKEDLLKPLHNQLIESKKLLSDLLNKKLRLPKGNKNTKSANFYVRFSLKLIFFQDSDNRATE